MQQIVDFRWGWTSYARKPFSNHYFVDLLARSSFPWFIQCQLPGPFTPHRRWRACHRVFQAKVNASIQRTYKMEFRHDRHWSDSLPNWALSNSWAQLSSVILTGLQECSSFANTVPWDYRDLRSLSWWWFDLQLVRVLRDFASSWEWTRHANRYPID